MALIDAQLLGDLRCPHCGSELEEDEGAVQLKCKCCGLAFPVDEGIPVLLIEEAIKPAGFAG